MGLIKMNGVNYWGSAYGQGIIAPMIYSTEEKEVGVWQDGKPLYQKTFTFSFTCTSDDQTTIIETLASDIDVKIISEGYVSRDNTRFKSGIYPPADIYYIFRTNDINNALDIRIGNSNGNLISGNVTIQYTKTTDTAGSGIYTPSGALAVHYSTNEQVIGTWIDGKPLYEKTFELTQQLDLTQDTWVKSELDQGTMKGLFYVLFTNDLGACLNNIVGGFIDNKIAFNSPRTISLAPAENTKVTLQYTKTTDV